MERALLILPDGTELFSGQELLQPILSAAFTEMVNAETELAIGSVCASKLEVSLLAPAGGLTIRQGTQLGYWVVDDSGNRTHIGTFVCEEPTRPSANAYKLTAYDNIIMLDKDLSQWLSGLDGWPYKLSDFASMVCAQCGLELKAGTFPNGGYLIQKFYAEGVTGRQLMQWLGQICARFCRATADGKIEFAWYRPNESMIRQEGENRYFAGTLNYADYVVAPIDKVQLRNGDSDVGVVYPPDATGTNAYVIDGNPLLAATSDDALRPAAKAIYDVLAGISYTPCKASVQTSRNFRAGDIVRVTDANGKTVTTYIMSRKQSGQKTTLESTGSASRGSSAARNSMSAKAMSGKLLNVEMTIDGIKAENRQMDKKVTSLTLDVDGIATEVREQGESISQIKQDSASVSLAVSALQNDTAAKLELCIKRDEKDQVVSMLNASAQKIAIDSDRLSIQSTNCTLTNDGRLTVKDADIQGKITATSGSFTGHIYSEYGKIGGWDIDDNSIYSNNGVWKDGTFLCTGNKKPYSIGGSPEISGWVIGAGGNFGVTKGGSLYAADAHIKGVITATSGSFTGSIHASSGDIAGWTIDSNSIFKRSEDGVWHTGTFMCTGSGGAYSIGGSGNIPGWVFGAGGKFGVTKSGDVYANALHIRGGDLKIATSDDSISLIQLNGNREHSASAAWGFLVYDNSDVKGLKHTHLDSSGLSISDSGGSKSTYSYAGHNIGSDRKLKEDISYLTDNRYVDFVRDLKPCTYRYIGSRDPMIGLIAQDVELTMAKLGLDFYGYCPPTDKNPYRALNYAAFVTPLIYALQNALNRIEKLEEKQ